jgi:phosphatidylglycerophosphate synthase
VILALTWLRVVPAAALASAVWTSDVGWALWWLSVFIVWDVADGWVARRFGEDGPLRRSADAVVDRAAIFGVLAVLVAVRPASLPWVLALVVVDAAVAASSWRCLRSTGVVAVGSRVHDASSLAVAAFGILASAGSDLAWKAGLLAVALRCLGAADLVRAHGALRGAGRGLAGCPASVWRVPFAFSVFARSAPEPAARVAGGK